MYKLWLMSMAFVASLLVATHANAGKPLKIFILAGQSNMQGHAGTSTFKRIGIDREHAELFKAMTDDKGQPRTVDNVWISEIGSGPDASKERFGKLNATYGVHKRGPKIGPEYTFGIYMAKHLNEPILIIKTAWGGKSLNTDFRPPSAGPYNNYANPDRISDEDKKKRVEASGVYYRKMMAHVKKVLADPKRVYPDYDPEAGYEIAGFVWFQGWNDMVDRGTYPNRNKIDGYKLYTELMGHFIRDVRKELNAPKMPFVIGVLGVGGVATAESEAARAPRYRGIKPAIEKAMSDPAKMPEFKGTVAAVMTGWYWDHDIDKVRAKHKKLVRDVIEKTKKEKNLSRDAMRAMEEKLTKENLSEREQVILRYGASNSGFHYYGSALTMGGIGKGFAEAMLQLHGVKVE